MPEVRCVCGARYRVPDAHLGKRARCPQCGETLLLAAADSSEAHADTIPLASPVGRCRPTRVSDATDPTEHQGLLGRGEVRFDPPTEDRQDAGTARPTPPLSVPGVTRGYFTDVLWTFLFPTDPGHLGVFFMIWVVLIVEACLQMVPVMGLAAALIIEGWFAAICLNVVASAANGEEELTIQNYAGDFFGDIVVPISKFFAATALAVLPAHYFLVFLIDRTALGPGLTQWDYVLGAALYGNYGSLMDLVGNDPLFFLLPVIALTGLFLWPMLLLVVAIGGFAALGRVDLMFVTIWRTLPVYAFTFLLVFFGVASVVAFVVLAALFSTGGPSRILLIVAFATGLRVYAQIVAMRVIGLYYHHFKRRFAWSWA